MILLWWLLLNFCTYLDFSACSEETPEQEGRIFQHAPAKSIVTLHQKFERSLFALRGCYVKVFQKQFADELHLNDSAHFEFNINKMMLENTLEIARPLGGFYQFIIGAYCSNNEMKLWSVTVWVSEPNKMPPQFSKKIYTFRCPYSATSGRIIGKVRAEDSDIIVYNSKVHYRLMITNSEGGFTIDEETGELRLMKNMKELNIRNSEILVVEACDYGSPQKCASAEIVVVPYYLTSPTNVRVLAANPRYQIVCWDAPEVGSPDIYILRVFNEMVHTIQKQYKTDVKSSKTKSDCAITHVGSKIGDKMSVLISGKSIDDQSTSEPVKFVVSEEFKCNGTCLNKGTPYCVNDSNGSAQAQWNGDKYCSCQMTYEGPTCANIKRCKEETVPTPYGATVWESTPVGVKVHVPCPYGPISQTMQRYCWFEVASQKAIWMPIAESDSSCYSKSNLLEFLGTSTRVINENMTTSLQTVKLFTDRCEKYLKSALLDFEVARAVMTLVDHLASSSPLKEVENVDLATRLRKLVTKYADNVLLPLNEKKKMFSSKNLALTVISVTNQSDISSTDVGQKMSLQIPDTVLEQAKNNSKSAVSNAQTQVTIVSYRNQNFHQNTEYRDQRHHPVLEIIVKGIAQTTVLAEPISFVFDTEKMNGEDKKTNKGQYICVFWDEQTKTWSKDGLTTENPVETKNQIRCKTTHLTGFSILLDFERNMLTDDENRFLLNLLSWIGCALSIAGLLLTMCTYAVFRYLNKEKAGKILLNLCSAMLLLNAAFILSSVRPYLNYMPEICITIGVVLHYATLATLLWMGVEAANMYHMLVHVFATSERHFMLKRCLIAWGLPAIIVGITVGVRYDYYYESEDNYCRLSPVNTAVHYGAFVGPACLVLVCNCIVFAFVIRVLSLASDTKKPAVSGQTQSTKANSLSSQIRGALSVMVLLGITWVFGAFAVGPARLPFMYVFCILNSSQGFIIFLVRCLLYEETRSAWLHLLRTGKIKKFRGKAYLTGTKSSDFHSTATENKFIRPSQFKSSTSAHAKRLPIKCEPSKNGAATKLTKASSDETGPLLVITEPHADTNLKSKERTKVDGLLLHDESNGFRYIDEPSSAHSPSTPVHRCPSCPEF